MESAEVEQIINEFTALIGIDWDINDWKLLTEAVPIWRFPVFLALLESRWAKDVEEILLKEAVKEIYDIYVCDVLKKVNMKNSAMLLTSTPMFQINWGPE